MCKKYIDSAQKYFGLLKRHHPFLASTSYQVHNNKNNEQISCYEKQQQNTLSDVHSGGSGRGQKGRAPPTQSNFSFHFRAGFGKKYAN